MSEGVDWINRQLIEAYGTDIGLGKPNFRLAWSTSQLEKRYGEFEVFSEAGIYLRTEKCVSEVPKYPEWPDKWVLERLLSTAGNPYLEMVTKFSYEPVWIFGAANSESQPIWRAVDLLIKELLYKKRKYLTRADYEEAEAKRMALEKERCKEIIQDESPWLPGLLKSGSAIVVPANYKESN
jgi:hypothetical protein